MKDTDGMDTFDTDACIVKLSLFGIIGARFIIFISILSDFIHSKFSTVTF